MDINKLNNAYFEWITQQITCDKRYLKKRTYRKLLSRLHETDFNYTIALDANRADDGIGLRYRFGYERGYEDAVIAACLDNRPCSVLEMMAALCVRCEEHIMNDPDIGDRTGEWFWSMIKNLGLNDMDDLNFDRNYTDTVINRFLNREYKRNGRGGLVTVHHRRCDLRSVEIWYQMMWYLDEVLEKRR